MSRFTRLLPVLFAGAVLVTAPACATTGVWYPQRGPVVDRDDRAYYNRGLLEGRETGSDDARRGRSYQVDRHREYRDNRRGDDRGDLRAYRTGFEEGYDEGYRRYARGNGGWDRRGGYPPTRDQGRRDRDDDRRVERGRFASAAAEQGYRDGFEAGRRAADKGDRFDPVREKQYREGDRGYDRRDGSRDDYKRDYRAAFTEGYRAGYR